MTATGIRMTADELLALPDNGMRRELIAGELHEMPPAGGEHGYVGNKAQIELGIFLKQHPAIGGSFFLAETGYRLSRNPDTVRAPDISYVNEERLSQARVRGYPELAPDFVVEVVSPNDTASEIQQKVGEWLAAGVLVVWVLYPATRTAMTFRSDGAIQLLHADDTIDAEPVLPGFVCRLGDLF
jgi:Uma2 family endonuclease